MQLIREFDVLVHDMWRLWRNHLPRMGTWLALGWLLQTSSNMIAALLGNSWGPLSIIIFVMGVTASVVSVILAILSLEPGLRTTRWLRTSDLPARSAIPTTVTSAERPLDVALLTIGPVLGVYAVWGVIDEMIRQGFLWNTVFSKFDVSVFSIGVSTQWLPTYLTLGLVAVVLRIGWARVVRDRRSRWWRVPLLFLEGLWVFSTFFIVLIGLREAQIWLMVRNVWRQAQHARHRFLEWLPDITLPFHLTLPAVVSRLSHWLVEVLAPALWEGIALPLVWLALVAIVFGWREFRVRDVLPQRFQRRPRQRVAAPSSPSAFSRAMDLLTEDLRLKYLPLAHALRLIWRSGPFVLGAFLVLAAFLEATRFAISSLLSVTFAAGVQSDMLRSFNAVGFVVHVLFTSLALCLYAATFDRGLADALGSTEPERPEDFLLTEDGHDLNSEGVEFVRQDDEH